MKRRKNDGVKRGVTLKLGIEADYFIGCEGELKELLALGDFDYIIGSVHFLNGWGFDNPDTKEYFEKHDLRALYDMFLKQLRVRFVPSYLILSLILII